MEAAGCDRAVAWYFVPCHTGPLLLGYDWVPPLGQDLGQSPSSLHKEDSNILSPARGRISWPGQTGPAFYPYSCNEMPWAQNFQCERKTQIVTSGIPQFDWGASFTVYTLKELLVWWNQHNLSHQGVPRLAAPSPSSWRPLQGDTTEREGEWSLELRVLPINPNSSLNRHIHLWTGAFPSNMQPGEAP